jgi:pyruvate dehydrogenase E1 component alpha subunit
VARIRAKDPLTCFAQRLTDAEVVDAGTLAQIEEDIQQEVQVAVEFAEASPEPDPARLFDFSYATPVRNQPVALPGHQP